MADIPYGDEPKRLVRIAAWIIRKYYKMGDKKAIHDDVVNCGNPVIRKLAKLMSSDNVPIEEAYQRSTISDMSELGFWILYKDTAYRDPFFYYLKKILDMKEELMPDIMKYYKEPEDWYVNAWTKSKNNTRRLKDEKILPDVPHELSSDENIFVPERQRIVFEEILKDVESKVDDEKKKRGWR